MSCECESLLGDKRSKSGRSTGKEYGGALRRSQWLAGDCCATGQRRECQAGRGVCRYCHVHCRASAGMAKLLPCWGFVRRLGSWKRKLFVFILST